MKTIDNYTFEATPVDVGKRLRLKVSNKADITPMVLRLGTGNESDGAFQTGDYFDLLNLSGARVNLQALEDTSIVEGAGTVIYPGTSARLIFTPDQKWDVELRKETAMFVFQVGTALSEDGQSDEDPTQHTHLARLSEEQAHSLVHGEVKEIVIESEPAKGSNAAATLHSHKLTITFDPMLHTFVVTSVSFDVRNPTPHVAWLIGDSSPFWKEERRTVRLAKAKAEGLIIDSIVPQRIRSQAAVPVGYERARALDLKDFHLFSQAGEYKRGSWMEAENVISDAGRLRADHASPQGVSLRLETLTTPRALFRFHPNFNTQWTGSHLPVPKTLGFEESTGFGTSPFHLYGLISKEPMSSVAYFMGYQEIGWTSSMNSLLIGKLAATNPSANMTADNPYSTISYQRRIEFPEGSSSNTFSAVAKNICFMEGSGYIAAAALDNNRYLIVKFDEAGTVLWQRQFTLPVEPDGNYRDIHITQNPFNNLGELRAYVAFGRTVIAHDFNSGDVWGTPFTVTPPNTGASSITISGIYHHWGARRVCLYGQLYIYEPGMDIHGLDMGFVHQFDPTELDGESVENNNSRYFHTLLEDGTTKGAMYNFQYNGQWVVGEFLGGALMAEVDGILEFNRTGCLFSNYDDSFQNPKLAYGFEYTQMPSIGVNSNESVALVSFYNLNFAAQAGATGAASENGLLRASAPAMNSVDMGVWTQAAATVTEDLAATPMVIGTDSYVNLIDGDQFINSVVDMDIPGEISTNDYDLPPAAVSVKNLVEIGSLRLIGGGLPPPADPTGSPGDKKGDVRFDSRYMYHCHKDYNGGSNIWGRVQLQSDWGV